MNPSQRFGVRVQLARLNFTYGEHKFNNLFYTNIKGLYSFSDNNPSLYALLNLNVYYDSDHYESSSFYSYTDFGFGVDWYFSNRVALFAELSDFLIFTLSKYSGGFNTNFDGDPKIVFGLKFNIYSGSKTKDTEQSNSNPPKIDED